MSVLASKRNSSRFEPIKHAVDLRILLTDLLIRNFGIKDIEHLARMNYAFGKDSKENLSRYMFILASCKKQIEHLARLIEASVRSANSIYPVNLDECTKRREYQNTALASCEQLISELQYVVKIFLVDVNSYRIYTESIDREIALIKKWRQSDNKLKKKLLLN